MHVLFIHDAFPAQFGRLGLELTKTYRLFKNEGYARETESLLMLVTPRIIITEEEEARATGIVPAPVATP